MQLFSLLDLASRLLELHRDDHGRGAEAGADLARRPRVLGALLEPAFYKESRRGAELAQGLAAIGQAHSYEEALDRARVFGQEQKFLIGARLMLARCRRGEAGEAYACWPRR